MSLPLFGGKIITVSGQLAIDAACCCDPPTCGTTDFTVTTFTTTWADASPCEACPPCNLTLPNQGPSFWRINWNGPSGITYKLWAKVAIGTPPDCADCGADPVDLTGYSLIGTYTEPQTDLDISRTEPETCDQYNYQCWALEIIVGDIDLICCATGGADGNSCLLCGTVEITASDGDCIPSGGGTAGVKAVNVSFTTTWDETCGTAPDAWEIFVDGLSVATGTGDTGSWSGEVSCVCDTTDPCASPTEVTVTWGDCTATVNV